MISRLDQLEVVLDHQDGVPLVDEPLKGADQAAHVLHVKPRRGLVEEEEGLALRTLGEMGHQLDSLGLAAERVGDG